MYQNQIDPALMSAFQTVETSKPIESNDYLPRLPDGTHEVTLTHFGGRNTQKSGVVIEAEFLVEKSNNPEVKPGDRRGQPWFTQLQGWAGGYERERYKTFTDACDQTLGNPARQPTVVGVDLAMGKLNGIRLRVEVQPRMNKKTGQRAVDDNGKPMSNSFFYFLAPQTQQEIDARKPSLPAPFARAPQGTGGQQFQQAPHPAQMQGQYPAQAAAAPQYAQQPQQPVYPAQGQPQYPPQPQAPAYPAPAPAAPAYPQYPAPAPQAPAYPQMPTAPQAPAYPQMPAYPGTAPAAAPAPGAPVAPGQIVQGVVGGLRQG